MEKVTRTSTYVTKNGTKVIGTELVDCYIVEPVVHGDHRGSFQETFNVNTLNILLRKFPSSDVSIVSIISEC